MGHRFVVPPLDGPTTGGTRFNRELIAGLARAGAVVDVKDAFEGRADHLTWVDTLFLDRVSAWADQGPVGLLTHYLPSLVSIGSGLEREQLRDDERAALAVAERFVVPSAFLGEVLTNLGVDGSRIAVVEPGVDPAARPRPHVAGDRVRAVLVANVTPGKQIAPLLHALGALGTPQFELRIVGSMTADREYAESCRVLGARLGPAVTFEGELLHSECLDLVARGDLLVSASKMESFGMAIADAQACGVPVLACEGGNVGRLVSRCGGGELVTSPEALANALVELSVDREGLQRRVEAARQTAVQRSWDVCAAEFAAFSDARTSRRTSDQTTR